MYICIYVYMYDRICVGGQVYVYAFTYVSVRRYVLKHLEYQQNEALTYPLPAIGPRHQGPSVPSALELFLLHIAPCTSQLKQQSHIPLSLSGCFFIFFVCTCEASIHVATAQDVYHA